MRRCADLRPNPLPTTHTLPPTYPKTTSLPCDMSDQPGSTRLRAHLESAWKDYEKNAGVKFAEHRLAIELQNCDSVESITTVLQGQVHAFRRFQGIDKVIESIKNTVSILYKISATTFLGDSVGLVCHMALMPCSAALTIFYSHSHLRKR